MKNLLSVLIITLCLAMISPLLSAGVALNIEGIQTVTLVEDLIAPEISYYVSIPSDVDRIIEPAPPISINYDGEFDGLDWYFVFYTNPLADPVSGTLATVTLTGPELFGLESPAGELTAWDETASTPLSTVFITVPEPATVILLGLGGMALRRRRQY